MVLYKIWASLLGSIFGCGKHKDELIQALSLKVGCPLGESGILVSIT